MRRSWRRTGLGSLLWFSPFVGLYFFPLAILFLYRSNSWLRQRAYAVLFGQTLVAITFFVLKVLSASSVEMEMDVNGFFLRNQSAIQQVLLAAMVLLSLVELAKRKFHGTSILFLVIGIVLSATILWVLLEYYKNEVERFPLPIWSEVSLVFGLSYLASFFWGKKKRLPFFIRIFAYYFEKIKILSGEKKIARAGHIDLVLPGSGHIALGKYWTGFSILFIYLLLLLFFTIAVFSYRNPGFGMQYLSILQLKPGISDRDFFVQADNVFYAIALFAVAVGVLFLSRFLLVRNTNLGLFGNFGKSLSGKEPWNGFWNHASYSLLVHLVILAILFIIPISLSRSSGKKKSESASNYQPEALEFYYIDSNVPDTVKGLNGGVINGTETPSQKQGEKITADKVSDTGKVKGYLKRIRGKKLPPTYSNYISAKMRGPEAFMEFWKRAPYPYSSVVAYTITQDGDIKDIELVEGSEYPDQDRLTLELIERMGTLMPPPDTKGDVRVTELFWNGAINPDRMPTPLQKDLVTMFDGRFMEEVEE